MIAQTPRPPYYAVIFSSVRTEVDEGYEVMSDRMMELAAQQDGFLGVESVRNDLGITVSYWKDLQSIRKWRDHIEHSLARKLGREKWYQSYKTRIALVEHDYRFKK
ncbi:MAG TPA: antibiotic biosynthesis monooxygenase [Sunxiuqinia sp.]|nr:antibiotic biosynthesis monooxygenase [Sunxiuqinia sp.]